MEILPPCDIRIAESIIALAIVIEKSKANDIEAQQLVDHPEFSEVSVKEPVEVPIRRT